MDLVPAAIFHKNTFRGHNSASSFELLFNGVLILTAVCNPIDHGSMTENTMKTRRCQIQAVLNAKTLSRSELKSEEVVYSWKDGQHFLGPGIVTEKNGSVVAINHNVTTKMADIHRVRYAPISRPLDEDEGSDTYEEPINVQRVSIKSNGDVAEITSARTNENDELSTDE